MVQRSRLRNFSRLTMVAFFVLLLIPTTAHSKTKAKVDKRQTVAVLYLDYSGKDPEMMGLQKGLASMILSELSDVNEVRFVERERIQAIMDELKLSGSKAVDKKTAARMGKLLGARYIVTGTYFTMLKQLRVDTRLIEVETGRIVKSVGANGSLDDFMNMVSSLATRLEGSLKELMPMQFASKTVRPRTKRKKRAKVSKKLALRFSKALDAKDKGDKATAKKELTAIAAEEPSFTLASVELAKVR